MHLFPSITKQMDEDQPCSPESDSADNDSAILNCSDIAEEAVRNILNKVQATTESQRLRKAIVDYIQRLISSSTCCQVFPFGSVPLKTYLPDGDIDLTAVTAMKVNEEAMANEVFSVLEREDQNISSEFSVTDVQIIHAEVKLVKCLVQNIVVDISFNQLGGISSLCFLEKVSSTLGKDHLFKRSIILIKAWCYYESRVLGSHHGLISTYALETLILYVFNRFYSSLNGPLSVLHTFLQYFSKFDWDNYCVTLNGPAKIASLQQSVVVKHEDKMFLREDFFKECIENFSVSHPNSKAFPPKHFNIVDPLKEGNNLGRSVSKGNSYRIRSALSFGARKLRFILSLPQESTTEELIKFFSNTMYRHGTGHRRDVHGKFLVIPPHVDVANAPIHSQISAGSLVNLDEELESHVSNLHHCWNLSEHPPKMAPSVPPYLSQVLRNTYMNPPLHIGSAFGVDEMPKPRGTGAYFTNLSYFNDRPPTPKERETSSLGSPRGNGLSHRFERYESSAENLEFGSFRNFSLNNTENADNLSSGECSNSSRVEPHLYELKDEGDFPPLSDKNR